MTIQTSYYSGAFRAVWGRYSFPFLYGFIFFFLFFFSLSFLSYHSTHLLDKPSGYKLIITIFYFSISLFLSPWLIVQDQPKLNTIILFPFLSIQLHAFFLLFLNYPLSTVILSCCLKRVCRL